MRIIFMGTPEFALPTLNALVEANHDVVAVYCQPPRPAGRGKALRASPVQLRAGELGIEVRHPINLKSAEEQAEFAKLGADVAVVAAYGLILPRPVLDAPRLGCVNVHASLLPRWRGAAPIQRAILAGDAITGVTIMQMAAGLDTGAMLVTREMIIDGHNAGQVTDKLADMGAAAMIDWLGDPARYPPLAQSDARVTYAAKIDKAETRIHWTESAIEIERQVRAFAPRPGAWAMVAGERVKILAARVVAQSGSAGQVLDDRMTIACGADAIRPLSVQRSGRAVMTPEELQRGFAVSVGGHLS